MRLHAEMLLGVLLCACTTVKVSAVSVDWRVASTPHAGVEIADVLPGDDGAALNVIVRNLTDAAIEQIVIVGRVFDAQGKSRSFMAAGGAIRVDRSSSGELRLLLRDRARQPGAIVVIAVAQVRYLGRDSEWEWRLSTAEVEGISALGTSRLLGQTTTNLDEPDQGCVLCDWCSPSFAICGYRPTACSRSGCIGSMGCTCTEGCWVECTDGCC